MDQQKRGRGRPPMTGTPRQHIDLTLGTSVIDFLKSMPAGMRSQFVDKAVMQTPEYQVYIRPEVSSNN